VALEWTTIGYITAVLGFLLSLIVFLVTRWEKRIKLDIQLFRGELDRFNLSQAEVFTSSSSIICMRIINLGVKAIAIDEGSFKVSSGDKIITTLDTEWVGLDRIPHPVAPGTSFEVGIFQDDFENLFGVAKYKPYMNVVEYEKCTIAVKAELKSISGKHFTSGNRYQYSFYVSEFWPTQYR